MAGSLWCERAVRRRRHGRVFLAGRRGIQPGHQDGGGHLPRQGADHCRRRRPDPHRHRPRPGSRAPGRPRHPAAAALPDRSRPGRPDRARGPGLQEREVRRHRLQPRPHQAHAELARDPGRALPQPGRLQGWRGQHRNHVLHLHEDGRTASPTWVDCPRPRSMPRLTRPWVRPCTRRRCSTSFRRRRWTSTRPWPPTTCRRNTVC